jgi:ribosome maturation factor RimP
MYRDIPHDLLELIEPIVLDHQLELVDALVPVGKGRQLRIVLDTPEGDGRVTVDECAAVSREIGHALDATDLIRGRYVLEVSSPGVDRILAREKDFERVVGRRVAVETREPLDGRRNFRGELVSFESADVCVETESGPVRIPFQAVARAHAFYPVEEASVRRAARRGR